MLVVPFKTDSMVSLSLLFGLSACSIRAMAISNSPSDFQINELDKGDNKTLFVTTVTETAVITVTVTEACERETQSVESSSGTSDVISSTDVESETTAVVSSEASSEPSQASGASETHFSESSQVSETHSETHSSALSQESETYSETNSSECSQASETESIEPSSESEEASATQPTSIYSESQATGRRNTGSYTSENPVTSITSLGNPENSGSVWTHQDISDVSELSIQSDYLGLIKSTSFEANVTSTERSHAATSGDPRYQSYPTSSLDNEGLSEASSGTSSYDTYETSGHETYGTSGYEPSETHETYGSSGYESSETSETSESSEHETFTTFEPPKSTRHESSETTETDHDTSTTSVYETYETSSHESHPVSSLVSASIPRNWNRTSQNPGGYSTETIIPTASATSVTSSERTESLHHQSSSSLTFIAWNTTEYSTAGSSTFNTIYTSIQQWVSESSSTPVIAEIPSDLHSIGPSSGNPSPRAITTLDGSASSSFGLSALVLPLVHFLV